MSTPVAVKRNPTRSIGLIVFAVAAGLFITITAAVAILARQSTDTSAVIQPSTGTVGDKSKRYTRDEFTKLVMGKTEAEVIAAVGRPDATDERPTLLWHYLGRILNPATGKYGDAAVYFKGGIVTEINW